MLPLILKKILTAIPTLFILLTLTFCLMRVIPGGPFDTEKAIPPDVKQAIDHKFGLDQPLWIQYKIYLQSVLSGDLGPSYRHMGGRTVNEIISESLPASLTLGAAALVFALTVGIPLGAWAAFYRGTALDASFVFLTIAGISLPAFLVAAVLILVFSVTLNWLPVALWEGPRSLILPVLTLGLRPMALLARLVRVSLLETLQTDYIRTAYAKGLPRRAVLFKHALRNSLIPAVTLLGPLTAAILTGSFLVETIFAIPGLGKYFVSAVIDRDYSVVMGVTLVYGVMVVACNAVVDILYGLIDPRMRVQL